MSDATAPSTDRPAAPAAARSRGGARRLRRWVTAAALLLLLYGLGGFLGVPWIGKRWIVPAIDDRLAGSFRLEEISFNPFTCALELRTGALTDPAGGPILAFERVRCDFDPLASLFSASWCFGELTVDRPVLDVRLDPSGRVNLLEALAEPPGAPGTAAAAGAGAASSSGDARAADEPLLRRIPRVRIAEGGIRDATLRVEDRFFAAGRPFQAEWSGATIDLGGLDLAPLRRSMQSLTARAADGSRVDWNGSLVPDPPLARGTIRLRDLPLAPFGPYMAGTTTATIAGGTLDFDLQYELGPTDTPPVARLLLPSLSLHEVRLMDGETLLLHGPRITLVGTSVDLPGRRLVVPSVRLSGAELHLVRDADGQPALLRLFPWAAAEAAQEVPQSAAPETPGALPEYPVERVAAAIRAIVRRAAGDWNISVESLALHDQIVRYTDRSPRRVVSVGLEGTEITAGPVESAERFAMPFDLRGRLIGGGAVELKGSIRPLDTDLEVTVDARGAALAPFAPYLPERPIPDLGAMELTAGSFTGAGTARSSIRWATRTIRAQWEGRALIDALSVERTGPSAPFAQVKLMEADGSLVAAIAPEPGATVDWKGEARVESAAVDAPWQDAAISARLAEARARGALSLAHHESAGAKASWQGTASTRNIELRGRRADGASAEFSLAALDDDGALRAEVPGPGSGAPITASHEGRLEISTLQASLREDARPRTITVGRAEMNGSLSAAAGRDGSVAARTDATLKAERLAFADTRSIDGSIIATIGSIGYRGIASTDLGGGRPVDLRSEGAVEVERLAGRLETERTGAASLDASTIRHQGAASLRGAAMGRPGGALLGGEASGTDLRAAAPSLDDAILEVREWSAKGLALDSAAPRAEIDTLAVSGASARLARVIIPRRTGAPSSGDAAASGSGGADASAASAPAASFSAGAADASDLAASLPEFTLRHFTLADGSLDLTDPSTTPPGRLRASKVHGRIDDLSTRGEAPLKVELEGLVEESGRFALRGSLHPFQIERATSVDFSLQALPLKPYDPYANRFVGHEVDSGRLTLHLPVRVESSALDGTLDATLDRFYLGRETPSEEAPDLPVKLGLALLRDANERIAVNIPFSGNLKDPSFELGGVVWQAVVNLLLKATTAPFTLLGALVGAGDRDLSQVVFEPGSAELTPERLADLDLLAKALAERPAISVLAVGFVAEPADLDGLRRAAFRDRVRSEQKLKPGEDLSGEALERAIDRAFRDLPRATREAVEREAPGGRPALDAKERAVAAAIEIDPAAVAALAKARADAVAAALVTAGVSADRIAAEAAAEPAADGPSRVTFELR